MQKYHHEFSECQFETFTSKECLVQFPWELDTRRERRMDNASCLDKQYEQYQSPKQFLLLKISILEKSQSW